MYFLYIILYSLTKLLSNKLDFRLWSWVRSLFISEQLAY